MLCRRNTKQKIAQYWDPIFRNQGSASPDVCQYVIKSYGVGRYLHSSFYEPSVPILALKCKAAVTDREALALPQPWTLV